LATKFHCVNWKTLVTFFELFSNWKLQTFFYMLGVAICKCNLHFQFFPFYQINKIHEWKSDALVA
jgi:hypothetical protein